MSTPFPLKSAQIVGGVAIVIALLGGAYAVGGRRQPRRRLPMSLRSPRPGIRPLPMARAKLARRPRNATPSRRCAPAAAV